MRPVIYETLAKLYPCRPVDRLDFIAEKCKGQVVLDIGCYDETALIKRGTGQWLHERIAQTAKYVIGLDNSEKIPANGVATFSNAKILKADGVVLNIEIDESISLIVAGEFIEHIESPIAFLKNAQKRFPGRTLLLSTPNGVSFANTLLGMISREAQHPDHLQVFTYKILNTLCIRSGITDYEIIPYRFFATEMLLASTGWRRIFVKWVEFSIRTVEKLFPLLSFGYIVRVKL